MPKKSVILLLTKRYYSINNKNNSELNPVPVLILKDLNNRDIIKSFK